MERNMASLHFPRTPGRLVAWIVGTRPPGIANARWLAAVSVAVLLALGWGAGYVLGGTDHFAPHWFYVPILFGAGRFGFPGTAVVALAAGVLAGPLLPAEVTTGRAQLLSDWLGRLGWFLFIGQAMAWVISRRIRTEEALNATWRTVGVLTERLRQHQDGEERRTRVEVRVNTALKGERLRMVFQPIVDLFTGRVVGLEALSRFDLDPRRDPHLWFSEARAVGRGAELELLALRRALDPIPVQDGLFVSVNLSPATMCAPGFADILADPPACSLVIEATEHEPVDDYSQLVEPLGLLRGCGGKLAVDDAGAGFASLRHILELGPELIKLDRELVRHVDDDPARRALATGLIAFAEELGASIVAEGIQTAAELETLRSLGVEMGQGYHLCRPLPLAELALDEGGHVTALAG
jgi:EAL domain-containing protein (putative c-di-GMP-specific phosphodiesterase class I)